LATGETSLTYLGEAGVNVAGYRWVYGEDDRKEFEPHLNLDGYEFSSWEDPQLTNVSDFPDSSFYFPGDHNGCRCLIEYLFA
jgi:GT2 family glycosyltransferase